MNAKTQRLKDTSRALELLERMMDTVAFKKVPTEGDEVLLEQCSRLYQLLDRSYGDEDNDAQLELDFTEPPWSDVPDSGDEPDDGLDN